MEKEKNHMTSLMGNIKQKATINKTKTNSPIQRYGGYQRGSGDGRRRKKDTGGQTHGGGRR